MKHSSIFTNYNLFKYFSIFILLVSISFLNIGGCSDDNGSTAIGPEGGTATSSDGRFTLTIPPGALTEDTEITLNLVPSNQTSRTILQETEQDFLVYDAQPSGLEFLIPATISGDLSDIYDGDPTDINIVLGFNLTEEGSEELGNQIYEIDSTNNVATYTAEITHFSGLVFLDQLSKAMRVSLSSVPSQNPANTKLVDFEARVNMENRLTIDETQEIDFVARVDEVEYFDFSSPMVLYNGEPTPFEINPNLILEEFSTIQPYDCGDPGPGLFFVDFVMRGGAAIEENFNPLSVFSIINLPFSPTPFNVFVRRSQEVLCVGEGPPPPPPPLGPVSLTTNPPNIVINHNMGGSPCPQNGDSVQVTVMNGSSQSQVGEVNIVAIENESFLNISPSSTQTEGGMANFTPSFPCSGFNPGANNGTVTFEARDIDTNELLGETTIDATVNVN